LDQGQRTLLLLGFGHFLVELFHLLLELSGLPGPVGGLLVLLWLFRGFLESDREFGAVKLGVIKDRLVLKGDKLHNL